jgi:hypothetical protein
VKFPGYNSSIVNSNPKIPANVMASEKSAKVLIPYSSKIMKQKKAAKSKNSNEIGTWLAAILVWVRPVYPDPKARIYAGEMY